MTRASIHQRACRALERQLAYQQRKSATLRGHEAEVMAQMEEHSREVRAKIDELYPIPGNARVLEVGSGAHGLIFFFDAPERIGIDPLAEEYRTLFPSWQHRANTIAAAGEQLPFEDGRFDVVLCDNVVDHAECPRRIVEEIARVLVPGGVLYFTVNVHHQFYHWAATAHANLVSLGVPVEITPFADHTVHLTLDAARRLFVGLPLKILWETDDIEETRRRRVEARHIGDQMKRLFFKNAKWEVVAAKA